MKRKRIGALLLSLCMMLALLPTTVVHAEPVPGEPEGATYKLALVNYGEDYSPEKELDTIVTAVNDENDYNVYLIKTNADGTAAPVDTNLYDLEYQLPSGSQNTLIRTYPGQDFYKLDASGIKEGNDNLTLTATLKESSESIAKTVALEVKDIKPYPNFSIAIYGIEYNYHPNNALNVLDEGTPYVVSLVRTKEDGTYSVVDTELYTLDIRFTKGDTYTLGNEPHKLNYGYAFTVTGKGDTRISDSVRVHTEGAFGSADFICPIKLQGGVPTGTTYDCVFSKFDDGTPIDQMEVIIGQTTQYKVQLIKTSPDGTKEPVNSKSMFLEYTTVKDFSAYLDMSVETYDNWYKVSLTGKQMLDQYSGCDFYFSSNGQFLWEEEIAFKFIEPKVNITEGLNEVTGNLANTEFNTVEKIENKLTETIVSNAGYTAENTALYDIELVTSEDGGQTWIPVTAENFPKEGIEVTFPYPDGTNGNEYNFTVAHMFDEDVNGHKAGELETPKVTAGKDGISFRLMGTSPVMIGYKKVAAAHTHSYGKWTDCKDGVHHQRTCSCGDVQKEAHVWDDGKVTKEATKDAEGFKTYTCKTCGATKMESIPKSASNSTTKTTSPKTGDSTNLTLWIAVMVAAGLSCIYFVRRKTNSNN